MFVSCGILFSCVVYTLWPTRLYFLLVPGIHITQDVVCKVSNVRCLQARYTRSFHEGKNAFFQRSLRRAQQNLCICRSAWLPPPLYDSLCGLTPPLHCIAFSKHPMEDTSRKRKIILSKSINVTRPLSCIARFSGRIWPASPPSTARDGASLYHAITLPCSTIHDTPAPLCELDNLSKRASSNLDCRYRLALCHGFPSNTHAFPSDAYTIWDLQVRHSPTADRLPHVQYPDRERHPYWQIQTYQELEVPFQRCLRIPTQMHVDECDLSSANSSNLVPTDALNVARTLHIRIHTQHHLTSMISPATHPFNN